MSVALHLTYFIKESQLQHGLRAEDYARYHHYLTNRLATLRSQLNLSNEKKKFLRKEVNVHNATDARHLMLLALYAERCWAAAEAMEERRQAMEGNQTEMNLPSGGIAPRDVYRKKLNKAVKWAVKLNHIAAEVGVKELRFACTAYLCETRGRAELSHHNYAAAKKMFMRARTHYCAEYRAISDEEMNIRDAVRMKVNEMSDRVIYCMQRLGENVNNYRPSPLTQITGKGRKHKLSHSENEKEEEEENELTSQISSAQNEDDAMHGIATLNWNGRRLNVTNMKVRDALREVGSVPSELTIKKVMEANGIIPQGQMNKILELLDRRISYYNDALMHVRHDLRSSADGTPERTSLQLLEHYVLYHVSDETIERALFLVEVYSRRFDATERVLESGMGGKVRKTELPASQFASPLEVVHLYKTAAEELEKMELLPGVAGQVELDALSVLCDAGKLIYTAEAWRVTHKADAALHCYSDALELLLGEKSPLSDNTHNVSSDRLNATLTRLAQLRDRAECAIMRMRAEEILHKEEEEMKSKEKPYSKTDKGASAAAVVQPVYLIDLINNDLQNTSRNKQTSHKHNDADIEVTVAQDVIPFPPPYQLVPCKAACVDVASSFVQFKKNELAISKDESVTNSKKSTDSVRGAHNAADNVVTKESQTKHDAEAKSLSKESAKSWGWRWAWGKK